MYIPKYYQETNMAEIEQLIANNGFAILVGIYNNVPVASHIPLDLNRIPTGGLILTGHISKANALRKCFEQNNDVLAIFTGPHAYVSPGWYNHKNVPTWNYQAVHVYGKVKLLEGDALKTTMRNLMDRYENLHAETPTQMEDVPEKLLQTDFNGIIVFEIIVERVEAASKLSQNRDAESYDSIIEHLKKSDAYDSKMIAEEMEKRKNKYPHNDFR